MKNIYDAVKHLKWKFVDWEKSNASPKDKKALKLIISHLRNEKKEMVYSNGIILKMYLSLIRVSLSRYKSINFASKRVHSMLDRDFQIILSEFTDQLNMTYYNSFCDQIGFSHDINSDNKKVIEENEKAYLEHVNGLWTKDEAFDSLSTQFLLMVNTFMK